MLRAYAAERLPLRLVVPTGVALAVAAVGQRTPIDLALDIALALGLFVQFRMWDDLEDRARDAIAHPSRVLVCAPSVYPVQSAAILLTFANVVLLAMRGLAPLAIYTGTAAMLATLYRSRRTRTAAGDLILLSKYPAFVAMLASGRRIDRPVALLVSLALVYVAACLYEVWHDSTSPLGVHS